MMEQQDLHAATRNGFLSLGKMDLPPFPTDLWICGVSQLSSCLTFQRQGAARQAVTLAGFTPRRPRQLWNTIATKIDWNMIALK